MKYRQKKNQSESADKIFKDPKERQRWQGSWVNMLNWSIVWALAPAPEGDLLLLLPGRNSQVSFGSTCAYVLSVIKRHKVVINMLSLPNPLSQKIRNLLSYELLIIKGGPVAQ